MSMSIVGGDFKLIRAVSLLVGIGIVLGVVYMIISIASCPLSIEKPYNSTKIEITITVSEIEVLSSYDILKTPSGEEYYVYDDHLRSQFEHGNNYTVSLWMSDIIIKNQNTIRSVIYNHEKDRAS